MNIILSGYNTKNSLDFTTKRQLNQTYNENSSTFD